MQSACYEQDNVVDHVTVRDKIQERWEGLNSMVAKMLELDDQFFAQFVVDRGDGQGRRFVRQKRPVIRAL